MVRTIVTPETQTVFFNIPQNYVGRELEVIAFAKGEGLEGETAFLLESPGNNAATLMDSIGQGKNIQPAPVKRTMKDFGGILSDETADDLRKQAELNRKQWDERLIKQF